jgi:LmbE family N-acetylglucosaminyl deacetylase
MFVVSPHLDDAVLGIGLQMAREPGGTCVTLLAGSPEKYPPLRNRPHDEICGFGGVADPMAARRAEDEAAMENLGWEPVHLALLDAQYVWPAQRALLDIGTATHALFDAWREAGEPKQVWTVAGLGHEDHHWTRRVVRGMCRALDVRMRVWFEPGYRTKFAQDRNEALRACDEPLRHYLLNAEESITKLRHIERYESQLHGISAMALRDALLAEVTGTWSRGDR